MRSLNFSIRVTLLIILGVLSLLITTQMVSNVYDSWVNHKHAKILKQSSVIINQLFNANNYLSLERGTSMSAIYSTPKVPQKMADEIKSSRLNADEALQGALDNLAKANRPDLAENISKIKIGFENLKKVRTRLDDMIKQPPKKRDPLLSAQFFELSTSFISDIHIFIETFSRPYLVYNQGATRQMRFSHLIWNISEYAGREYAVLGTMIAKNQLPNAKTQESLSIWNGRIQYAWELAHTGLLNNVWGDEIKPYLDDAESKYFITFEQVKNAIYFSNDKPGPLYPHMDDWIDLASSALGSMHEMNNAVLKVNQAYIDKIEAEANNNIIKSLLWFGCVGLLIFYSWRTILTRVIRPVNFMIGTLDNAVKGDYTYDAPKVTQYQDEIGALADLLDMLQQNSRQLQMERDKAQAANIAKSDFLANMSHEIRTPMNVVLGLSNILSLSDPLNEKQKELLKTLQLSAESLLSIINSMLDFSKIETKNFELEMITFDLGKIVEEVTRQMSIQAQEKGLEFKVETKNVDGKYFTGDPTRVRQILVNLCGNAIKFTTEGTVTLNVENSSNERNTHITVTDTGMGIPLDKQEMVFEKFTQADNSITRKFGGTGLGLAITKTFVEMMNGLITVESDGSSGSSFEIWISLPETNNKVIDDAPSAKLDILKEVEKDMCILLVEDFKPNIIVAREYLEKFGFCYDIAENGHDAIDLAGKTRYHAILMDIQMHEIDGYETTRIIRNNEKARNLKRVKIIGITAHALVGDREKCLEAGMDDYISKPFKPEDLRRKLAA